MPDTRLIIERLNPTAVAPRKANPSDACFDLFAPEATSVPAGERVALGLGLALQIEEGWEAQIRGRSGLAKRGIEVHFGTIDHLFRQELKVLVYNGSGQNWEIQPGDRVAQMKLARVWDVEIVEAAVTPTGRGGLGSTGR